jgi:hypothetical protein
MFSFLSSLGITNNSNEQTGFEPENIDVKVEEVLNFDDSSDSDTSNVQRDVKQQESTELNLPPEIDLENISKESIDSNKATTPKVQSFVVSPKSTNSADEYNTESPKSESLAASQEYYSESPRYYAESPRSTNSADEYKTESPKSESLASSQEYYSESLRHYVESLRSTNSADEYKTESPKAESLASSQEYYSESPISNSSPKESPFKINLVKGSDENQTPCPKSPTPVIKFSEACASKKSIVFNFENNLNNNTKADNKPKNKRPKYFVLKSKWFKSKP